MGAARPQRCASWAGQGRCGPAGEESAATGGMPTGHTVAMAAVVGALTVGALHSQHEERKRLRLEREAEQEREAQDQKEDDFLERVKNDFAKAKPRPAAAANMPSLMVCTKRELSRRHLDELLMRLQRAQVRRRPHDRTVELQTFFQNTGQNVAQSRAVPRCCQALRGFVVRRAPRD